MRFKDIEDREIRESAISQYLKQLASSNIEKHQVVTHYVSFLDYYNTVEGYDYWNEIRSLRNIPTASGFPPARRFIYRGETPLDISEELKQVIANSSMDILELSRKSGYALKYLNEILANKKKVGQAFINDISFIIKINPKQFLKQGETIQEGRKIDDREIPPGEKRICNRCNKSKDLATEFNKLKYGVYQKAGMCRDCYNKEYKRKYKEKKKSK